MWPDYLRPRVDTAEQFRITQTEGQSIANLPWWELLRDEELQRLINQALLENRNLKQALASVDEFQARSRIAFMDFVPNMDADANATAFGTMSGFGIPGFPTPFNYFGRTTLNWEIDIWGRIRRSNEAARADLMAREENRRAIILTLISAVAQSYFDLLQFDVQLDIAHRALSSWQESVNISRAQLQGGIISRLDLDQFEAEHANAAARVAELERKIVQKENELSVLIGRNPASIVRGHSLTEQLIPPEVPAADRPGHGPGDWRRGPDPMARSGARRCIARRVHPGGGGLGLHRADRGLGDVAGGSTSRTLAPAGPGPADVGERLGAAVPAGGLHLPRGPGTA